MEGLVLFLELLQCEQQALECGISIVEDGCAKRVPEFLGIGGAGQSLYHFSPVGIAHLMRRRQRSLRLRGEGLRPAVMVEAAGRRAIGGKEECRREIQVAQRWRGAESLLVHPGAAYGHRQSVGLRMGCGRSMAGGAGLPAAGGQRLVAEYLLAQERRLAELTAACRGSRDNG